MPPLSQEDALRGSRWSKSVTRERRGSPGAARAADYDPPVPRHFLTGEELGPGELDALLARAEELKRTRASLFDARPDARGRGPLAGRSIALIFDKPSTRTRISFEVAVHELGGHAVVLREGETQLARGESERDTALVLSRLVQAVGIRAGPHAVVEELAASSSVPVVNMLTAEHHPCQALADLMTLRERFGTVRGLRVAYVGDGNNVATSLMLVGARAGAEVRVATPPELAPPAAIVEAAQAAAGPGSGFVTTDAAEAASGAHAVYTDVWVSMGDESEATRRRELLALYRLDAALLAHAHDEAIVLHCLPAHPGEEIDEELLYGERSGVWDQAENRLHTQKALLEALLLEAGADEG
jgi:ornithine carbamoyltransferase